MIVPVKSHYVDLQDDADPIPVPDVFDEPRSDAGRKRWKSSVWSDVLWRIEGVGHRW